MVLAAKRSAAERCARSRVARAAAVGGAGPTCIAASSSARNIAAAVLA